MFANFTSNRVARSFLIRRIPMMVTGIVGSLAVTAIGVRVFGAHPALFVSGLFGVVVSVILALKDYPRGGGKEVRSGEDDVVDENDVEPEPTFLHQVRNMLLLVAAFALFWVGGIVAMLAASAFSLPGWVAFGLFIVFGVAAGAIPMSWVGNVEGYGGYGGSYNGSDTVVFGSASPGLYPGDGSINRSISGVELDD